MASENNLRKWIPALQEGFVLLLNDLDRDGAVSGYVIKFDGTDIVWAPEGVSPGEIALPNTQLLVGNASNVAAAVALSGDATISNLGVMTIANSAISTAKLADNSVTGAKIALASQAAGDIMYYDGTDWVRLAKGTAGQVLTMNAGATAPEWQTP